jgi:hypothetical protein
VKALTKSFIVRNNDDRPDETSDYTITANTSLALATAPVTGELVLHFVREAIESLIRWVKFKRGHPSRRLGGPDRETLRQFFFRININPLDTARTCRTGGTFSAPS